MVTRVPNQKSQPEKPPERLDLGLGLVTTARFPCEYRSSRANLTGGVGMDARPLVLGLSALRAAMVVGPKRTTLAKWWMAGDDEMEVQSQAGPRRGAKLAHSFRFECCSFAPSWILDSECGPRVFTARDSAPKVTPPRKPKKPKRRHDVTGSRRCVCVKNVLFFKCLYDTTG